MFMRKILVVQCHPQNIFNIKIFQNYSICQYYIVGNFWRLVNKGFEKIFLKLERKIIKIMKTQLNQWKPSTLQSVAVGMLFCFSVICGHHICLPHFGTAMWSGESQYQSCIAFIVGLLRRLLILQTVKPCTKIGSGYVTDAMYRLDPMRSGIPKIINITLSSSSAVLQQNMSYELTF